MNTTLWKITVLAGCSSLVGGWGLSPGEESTQPESMPLAPMMKQLLTDAHPVDNGLYAIDFEAVEKGAGNRCVDCRSGKRKPIAADRLKAGR